MNCPRVCTVLAATLIAALPGAALAQFPPAPGSPSAPVQDRWPDPPKSPPWPEPGMRELAPVSDIYNYRRGPPEAIDYQLHW